MSGCTLPPTFHPSLSKLTAARGYFEKEGEEGCTRGESKDRKRRPESHLTCRISFNRRPPLKKKHARAKQLDNLILGSNGDSFRSSDRFV